MQLVQLRSSFVRALGAELVEVVVKTMEVVVVLVMLEKERTMEVKVVVAVRKVVVVVVAVPREVGGGVLEMLPQFREPVLPLRLMLVPPLLFRQTAAGKLGNRLGLQLVLVHGPMLQSPRVLSSPRLRHQR